MTVAESIRNVVLQIGRWIRLRFFSTSAYGTGGSVDLVLEERGTATVRKPSARSTGADHAALLVVRESEALSSSRKARSAFRTTPLRCLRVRASSTPPPPFSPPGDSLRSSPEPCAHSVRARHQSQHSTAALPSPSSREERGPWCPRERSERGGSRDAKRLSSCGKSPIFQQLRRACSPGGMKGRGPVARSARPLSERRRSEDMPHRTRERTEGFRVVCVCDRSEKHDLTRRSVFHLYRTFSPYEEPPTPSEQSRIDGFDQSCRRTSTTIPTTSNRIPQYSES